MPPAAVAIGVGITVVVVSTATALAIKQYLWEPFIAPKIEEWAAAYVEQRKMQRMSRVAVSIAASYRDKDDHGTPFQDRSKDGTLRSESTASSSNDSSLLRGVSDSTIRAYALQAESQVRQRAGLAPRDVEMQEIDKANPFVPFISLSPSPRTGSDSGVSRATRTSIRSEKERNDPFADIHRPSSADILNAPLRSPPQSESTLQRTSSASYRTAPSVTPPPSTVPSNLGAVNPSFSPTPSHLSFLRSPSGPASARTSMSDVSSFASVPHSPSAVWLDVSAAQGSPAARTHSVTTGSSNNNTSDSHSDFGSEGEEGSEVGSTADSWLSVGGSSHGRSSTSSVH